MSRSRHIVELRYCWICEAEFDERQPQTGDMIEIDCPTCGKYAISATLYASRFPLADDQRYRMSYWSMQRKVEGREPPFLTAPSIGAVLAELPEPAAHEKSGILLLALTRIHPTPGKDFPMDLWRKRSLACARSEEEMKFFMYGLAENKYIDRHREPGKRERFRITHAGWERAAQLAVKPQASRRGFVALHYTDELLELFRTAFAPAINRAGFEPRLADYPIHNEQIDARIVTEIRQARFVVADVTGARTGVYFEAGYALGQGRPVIWTCRESARADMHFDTRQYNHILWKGRDDLEEQLYLRITATI